MKHIIFLLSFFVCSVLYINAQKTTDESMFDFTSKAKMKKKEKLNSSPYTIFGDSTVVLMTEHEKNLDHSLKIPLLEEDKQVGLFELNFQTGIITIKDSDGNLILNQELSPEQLSRFLTIDPLAEKYYSWSPYVYVMNNPMKYIDPDGCSTWVKLVDGQYQVFGGDLNDKDVNIYMYSQNKEGEWIRGNSVGVTTSTTSFYNDTMDETTGQVYGWMGTINPNDKSGENFLGSIFGNTPSLKEYMPNATGGKPYDFKVTNGEGRGVISRTEEYKYRGMPIGSKDGRNVYTSARDIGNIAAGYVAGANGMPWGASRVAFDGLQSYQNYKGAKMPGMEGMSTQNAEYFGWKLGNRNVPAPSKLENLKRAINSFLGF